MARNYDTSMSVFGQLAELPDVVKQYLYQVRFIFESKSELAGILNTDDLMIRASSTEGTVTATATEAGIAHNGFAENTIKYIVDNTPFLASATNTTPSLGGTDIESDDNLRERIRLVPESFSTAGCEDGYVYWAKTASADVGDVVTYSPVNDTSISEEARKAGAGKVYIYILKSDGSIPSADDPLLSDVFKAVSAKDKRPLTDKVEVLPPSTVNYAVSFRYYVAAEDEANANEIKNAVTLAVSKYIAWQSEKIGRDINPDKFRSLILNAGASRVELTSPASYVVLNRTQVAALSGEITATYAGISE